MEYLRITSNCPVDISLRRDIRSYSDNTSFGSTTARPTTPRPSQQIYVQRRSSPEPAFLPKVIAINDTKCCGAPSLTKMKSGFQLFKMHLYSNHKFVIFLGVVSIIIGVCGLFLSIGMSSVISWCLITGGAGIIGGVTYHSASVALSCGPCKPRHPLEYVSDSEIRETPEQS